MSAAVLFIPDQSEIVHIEQADYRKFRNPNNKPNFKSITEFLSLGAVFVRCWWCSRSCSWYEFRNNLGHVRLYGIACFRCFEKRSEISIVSDVNNESDT